MVNWSRPCFLIQMKFNWVNSNQLQATGSNGLQTQGNPSTGALSGGPGPFGRPLCLVLLVVSVILRQAPPSGGPAIPRFHSADLSRERVSFQSTPAGDLGLRSRCGFRPLSCCEPVTVAGVSLLCSPTLVTRSPTAPRDEIGPPKVTGAGGWGGWFLKGNVG